MPTRTYNPWPPGWYGFDTTCEMCAAWGGETSQVSAGVHPAPDVHPDDHGEILTFLVLSPEQVRQLRTAVKGEISTDLRALLDGARDNPTDSSELAALPPGEILYLSPPAEGPASSDDGYPTEPGMWLVSAVLADLTDGYEPCEVVEHENLLCIHLGDGVYERASNYGWNGRA